MLMISLLMKRKKIVNQIFLITYSKFKCKIFFFPLWSMFRRRLPAGKKRKEILQYHTTEFYAK